MFFAKKGPNKKYLIAPFTTISFTMEIKMKKAFAVSLTICTILCINNAYADMFTFDFTNDGRGSSFNAQIFAAEDGNLSLMALAQYYNPRADEYGTTRLSWGNAGLWINNSPSGPGTDSSHQIDGQGWDERVLFGFAQDVTIKSVSFNYVGYNDDFAFWVGEDWNSTNLINDDIDIPNNDTYVFNGIWTDSYFAIGAVGCNDDFKITGMSINYDPSSAAPVPEPATMLLFGTGLAGLAAGYRRKQKK